MQAILFDMNSVVAETDSLWLRAAIRECIAYGEHGLETETDNGRTICFNCRGTLQ